MNEEFEELCKWTDSLGLTFGFELEGEFTYAVTPEEFTGAWKQDGTVRRGFYVDAEGKEQSCSGVNMRSEMTEYNSPVYSFRNMIGHLKKFQTGTYHFWNYHSGLHLHISSSDTENKAWLKAQLYNFDFLSELHKEMLENTCLHQKHRLESSSTCSKWADRETLRRELYYPHKYRFMNNHRSGTHEFRFVCPCEHKVENIIKMMKIVKSYMEQEEVVISLKGQVERTLHKPIIDFFEITKGESGSIDEALIYRNGCPEFYSDEEQRIFYISSSQKNSEGHPLNIFVAQGRGQFLDWITQYCGYGSSGLSAGQWSFNIIRTNSIMDFRYMTTGNNLYWSFSVEDLMMREHLIDTWKRAEKQSEPFNLNQVSMKKHLSKLLESLEIEESFAEAPAYQIASTPLTTNWEQTVRITNFYPRYYNANSLSSEAIIGSTGDASYSRASLTAVTQEQEFNNARMRRDMERIQQQENRYPRGASPELLRRRYGDR